MTFLTHFTIALISLIVIVLSCVLFTNAIEFLGNKLKLGNSATGSILAVFGTGLPETIVPVVAILGSYFSNSKIELAKDVALGAVVGSPFMLSTLALFFLSIVLILKKKNRLYLDYKTAIRDYKYFLLGYIGAFIFSYFSNFKYIAIILLLILYCIYVQRTILKSRTTCIECECEKLYFNFKQEKLSLTLQLLFSLILLVVSSHFFVCEIKYFSDILNISPLLLSLIITPFATELPECINSIIWLYQGKDDLAIANILGAIVFQATVVFALGILLTNWNFSTILIINFVSTIIITLATTLSIMKFKKITLANLFLCGIIYFAYFIFVLLK